MKIYSPGLFLLLCSLPAAAPAAMSGGSFSVPALAALSGGGSASGGSFSASSSLGGPSFSAAAPAGGSFSVITGGAPAIVTVSAARGGLGAAHCYPVPFRPATGHTVITFTGLTRQASVRVYTISGELVRALEKNDAGETLSWDARNASGSPVASGVYFYVVKGGGQTASGKLMVIW